MKQQVEIGAMLKIEGMQLELPCSYRAQCYIRILKDVCKSLLKNLGRAENIFDIKSVCRDLLQELVQLLDSRVMDSVNDDLLRKSEIYNEKYKKLNPILALIRYYIDSGDKQYSDYLFSLDVNLQGHLEELAKNFVKVNVRLITRIRDDYSVLVSGFLQENAQDNIRLRSIHFTGSDRHHFGQQVCILEFVHLRKGPQKFIVYKPKPCTASAFLIGDMKKLSAIDPLYQNCNSLNELLNIHLHVDDRLTTYLIWPCVDKEYREGEITDVPIDNSYGYVEYVSHEPWCAPNVPRIIANVYNEFSQRAFYSTHEITNEVDKRCRLAHVEALRQAAQAMQSDFIINSQDDWEKYSRICGIYTMAFIFAGVTDIHHGNIIMSKGLPVPIDIEICMSVMPYKIQSVGCLNSDNGAMCSSTLKPQGIRVLNDINGIHIVFSKVLENNRLYRLYRRVNNTLIACPPMMEHFFQGLENTLDCLIKLEARGKLTQWILSLPLQTALLRVIPFETAVFQKDLLDAMGQRFDKSVVAQQLRSRLKSRLEDLNAVSEEDIKNSMIYLACNVSYLQDEYQMNSTPCFWIRANSTRLLNGASAIVKFPENFIHAVEHLTQVGEDALVLQDNFYDEAPINILMRRLVFLCNKDNHAKLLSDFRQEDDVQSQDRRRLAEEATEFSHDDTFFTVVHLYGQTPPMIHQAQAGYNADSDGNEDSDEISKSSTKKSGFGNI